MQHVYAQSGQLAPLRGVSSYYSTVYVGYRLSQPSTSYVNIAKGEGPLRSRVVSECFTVLWLAIPAGAEFAKHSQIFWIDAHKRTVKLKEEGDRKVPLSTAKFDNLLDSITEAVHTSHQERAEALIIERRLEVKAEADRLASAAACEQAERDSAHTAQPEEAQTYQHKLALLLTKLEAAVEPGVQTEFCLPQAPVRLVPSCCHEHSHFAAHS